MNEISEYWDRRPCNVGHGISPVGTEEWSTEVAIRKYFVEPHIVWFADFARWKDKKVLEIGCGIGTDTREFIRHGVGHIDAMDISSGSLNLAAKRSWQVLNKRQLNLPDKLAWDNPVATFHLANAEDFQPLGPFNLIYSFGVLHHTPNPKKVLEIARRGLAPDGELRIMIYAKYSWKHLFTLQQPEAQAGCPYVKWYSKREARKLLESCGFKVVSITKTHIFPWRIPEYRNHLYKKAFPWSLISEKYFERFLGHHLLIVAVKA